MQQYKQNAPTSSEKLYMNPREDHEIMQQLRCSMKSVANMTKKSSSTQLGLLVQTGAKPEKNDGPEATVQVDFVEEVLTKKPTAEPEAVVIDPIPDEFEPEAQEKPKRAGGRKRGIMRQNAIELE